MFLIEHLRIKQTKSSNITVLPSQPQINKSLNFSLSFFNVTIKIKCYFNVKKLEDENNVCSLQNIKVALS